MLTLRDPAIAAAALPDKPEPYRRLDTAVLEALVLRGALGMSEDDISHLRGLDYSKSLDDAIERVESGDVMTPLVPDAEQPRVFVRGIVRPPTAAGEKIGTISRIVIDVKTRDVTDLVVDRGLLSGQEKVVPVGLIDDENEDRPHPTADQQGAAPEGVA